MEVRYLQPSGSLCPHHQHSLQRARLGMDRPSTMKNQSLGLVEGNAVSSEASLVNNWQLYQLTGKSPWLSPLRLLNQKLSSFKVEKFLYKPTMTMFHDSSCQVPPFLTLGSNMSVLVDNLPVMHHMLPERRKESRVTTFLWNASQEGYQWILLAIVKKNFLIKSWYFVCKAALFIQ